MPDKRIATVLPTSKSSALYFSVIIAISPALKNRVGVFGFMDCDDPEVHSKWWGQAG